MLLGKCDSAVEDFDTVLDLDPDNASALRERGLALGTLGRFDEAIRDYEQSLRLEPNNPDAFTARGWHTTASNGMTWQSGTSPGPSSLTPAPPRPSTTGE